MCTIGHHVFEKARGSHASLASTDIETEENSVHINGVSVSSGLKLKKM